MIETKFKQTEFGAIPEGWQESNLSDVLKDFTTGATPYRGIKDFYTGLIPWVSSGELNYNIIKDTNEHITEIARQKTNLKQYPAGTFLMAITGLEAEGTRGKCAILGTSATTNQSCLALSSTDKMIVDYWFYFYQFWSDWYAFRFSQGTKQQSYKADTVKKFPVIFPLDIKEQKRIAEALSNIDNLISSLSKMIEKKRLVKQGIMQQLLTGKKRLSGFEGEWDELLFGEHAKIYRGGSPRPIEQYITYRPDGINWIKIGDVSTNARYIFKTEEKIIPEGISHSREVHKGDFILSNSMSYGRPYIVMIDGCIHDGWLVIKDYSDTFDMNFLYYVLGSDYIMAQYASMAAGSSVKNLNKEKVSNLNIYTPQSINEQLAIANILITMDNEIESLEEERDKYIRLKEGMMQKLLTGQIRLIEAETKQTSLPKAKVANVYFKRSVLAAEIADRLCEEQTFGHVKMQKLIFLTEHLCHIDINSHYHRDVAGPYDSTAIRSIDSQMKKQKWFEAKKENKGYKYLPMQNRGGHKKYFEKYYSDIMPIFEKVVNTFKSCSTEQCEIVATLYSAWDDLLHSGHSFSDDDILNEVLNNWNESKKRIQRSRWQTALDWMRNQGFTPQ